MSKKLFCLGAGLGILVHAQAIPQISLAPSYKQELLGSTTLHCVKLSTDPQSVCTRLSGDPRMSVVNLGNMVDARGFTYGVVSQTSTILDIFRMSSEGGFSEVGSFETLPTCSVMTATEALATARSLALIGYNLNADALYLRIGESQRRVTLLNPQDGFTLRCDGVVQPSVVGSDGTKIPRYFETTELTTSVVKIDTKKAKQD